MKIITSQQISNDLSGTYKVKQILNFDGYSWHHSEEEPTHESLIPGDILFIAKDETKNSDGLDMGVNLHRHPYKKRQYPTDANAFDMSIQNIKELIGIGHLEKLD